MGARAAGRGALGVVFEARSAGEAKRGVEEVTCTFVHL